jgi:hypothetical protein
MLFTSLSTVFLIVNVILLRNLPIQIINTISVHFFDSFTCCTFYPLGTVFGSIVAIYAIFADLRNDSFTFPLFVDVYTYSPIYSHLFFLCPFPSNHTYILFG